jgi:hypothetical protein
MAPTSKLEGVIQKRKARHSVPGCFRTDLGKLIGTPPILETELRLCHRRALLKPRASEGLLPRLLGLLVDVAGGLVCNLDYSVSH